MKKAIVFILFGFLLLGVAFLNGNIKVKVTGRMVVKSIPRDTVRSADTIKVGLVLDCTQCADKTLHRVLDGAVWRGYEINSGGQIEYLFFDKNALPEGCKVAKVVK